MDMMETPATNCTAALADFAANVRYDDLPPRVVSMLKLVLLDTLGTALAATTLGDGCAQLVAVAGRSGVGPCTILGTDVKVSAAMAAMANGGLAHALNFDPITGHLGVSAFAPELAVAEEIGGIDGKTFLSAVAAAAEVTARIVTARTKVTGNATHGVWLEGQILGYYGAAAGAGRIMGLNSAQMRDAFGLALMQTAGSMQIVYGGDPPAKAIYGAFPNFAGVLSAQLAAEGLGADCNALDGEAGLFASFFAIPDFPLETLNGLGRHFLVERVAFKPWPTSGIVHPFIQSALSLYGEGVRADAIDRIVVHGSERARAWCEPVAERSAPANGASAANSVLFGVAKALTAGAVTLGDFTDEGIKDPAARRVAKLITPNIGVEATGSARVEVFLKNGDRKEAYVKAAMGTLDNPMTRDQIVEKFNQCAEHAKRPLNAARRTQIVEAIENIESIRDMRELVALLA